MHKTFKRKTGMARLLELAFLKKGLSISVCALSALSAAFSFTPYIAIYYIIRELAGHLSGERALDAALLIRLGWLAAGGAVSAVLLNWFALLCSHFAAFTTIFRLKLDFTAHVASLPLGFHTANATGKLRKIVDDNIEKLEGFIAHQLPDIAGTFTMPVITLVILFFFDWRLGLASFIPIILSYLIQSVAFAGKNAQYFMKHYQNALEEMNSAAVEYARGIPVIKVFNQTIFSFRKFRETIARYGKFVMDYTLAFKMPWQFFMTIIHHVSLFLLPVIILLAGGAEDYGAFAMAALFYLVFSFYIATPFIKIMYVAQSGRLIADGIERMDKMLDTPPLPEPANPQTTAEYSVSFENVTFYYAGEVSPPLQPGAPVDMSTPKGAATSTSVWSSASPSPRGSAPKTPQYPTACLGAPPAHRTAASHAPG
jgi:ATP-binding cassette subfamily B protein